MKNPNAVALGKLGRGKPKCISPQKSERRRKSLARARTFMDPVERASIAARARWARVKEER